MPKIKTNKTLSKRVKITKNGKIKVGHIRNGHLKRKFTANRASRKKGYRTLKANAFQKMIKQMLGKKGSDINLKDNKENA